jgi:sugar lactone lactonase YvrE
MSTFLGTAGSANNQLYSPYGISHDWNTGILYIADTYNNRIMSYASGASTGTMVIGGTGTGSTQLSFPTGLYFDSLSNSLYIANSNANNIVRWVVNASTWILVAGSINGSSGTTATLLNYPRDVTLDSMGNVYVADAYNNRIQFFIAGQSNGTTIAGVTGISGSNSTLLNGPTSLVVDSQFNVYVADSLNNRVQRFDYY